MSPAQNRSHKAGDPLRLEEEDKSSHGRPRNPAIDDQILEAARRLLATKGYEALSFEAISKMTAIARPTIYRRWPSKPHLAAAIAYGGDKRLPEIAGGDLETQIRALVQQVADQYGKPEVAAASIGLITAFHSDDALRRELHTPAETDARAQLRGIIQRAKARGVVRDEADADLLFDTIVGTIVFRMIFSSTEKPSDFAERLTQHLCLALNGPPERTTDRRTGGGSASRARMKR